MSDRDRVIALCDTLGWLSLVAAGACLCAWTLLGCGASSMEAAETARVGACQAAEAAIEHGCQPDCGQEDYARVDCVRLVCDEMHDRLSEEE